MKKRLFAGMLLAVLIVGFTAWETVYAPQWGRADSLPPSVIALLPKAARYEKQTLHSYALTGVLDGEEGKTQTMSDSVLVTVHCYDGDDRLLRTIMHVPDGNISDSYIEYQYDNAGRRIALISHNKDFAKEDGSDIITQIDTVYDVDGRAVSEEQHTLGSVIDTVFSYDDTGRKTGLWVSRQTDGQEDGHGTFLFDENDRIVWKEELSQFHVVTEYVYDAYGEIEQAVQRWDGRDPVTTRMERTYDDAGHPLTEMTYQNGELQSYTESSYDLAGQLLQMTRYDAAGNVTERLTCEQIIR